MGTVLEEAFCFRVELLKKNISQQEKILSFKSIHHFGRAFLVREES